MNPLNDPEYLLEQRSRLLKNPSNSPLVKFLIMYVNI